MHRRAEFERNRYYLTGLREPWAGLGLPSKDQADIAGHATRILEHLGPEVEAERPEVLMPEFVSGLGAALQSLFPLGLRIIDSPAVVAAQGIREAVDLDFALSSL